jgi:hypothetical protein
MLFARLVEAAARPVDDLNRGKIPPRPSTPPDRVDCHAAYLDRQQVSM